MRKTINNQNPSRVNVFGGGLNLNSLLSAALVGCISLGAQGASAELAPAPISETADTSRVDVKPESEGNSLITVPLSEIEGLEQSYGEGSNSVYYKFDDEGNFEKTEESGDAEITVKYDEKPDERVTDAKKLQKDGDYIDLTPENKGGDDYASGGAVSLGDDIPREKSAMAIDTSLPDISGLFSGNHAKMAGGAIYNNIHLGTISGEFIGNYLDGQASIGGGAIYNNESGTIENIKAVFIGNHSSTTTADGEGDWANGGAIYNAGNIKNIDSTFVGNYASANKVYSGGGAIFNDKKIDTITGSFYDNYAHSIASEGGAIHNDAKGEIGTIENATFESNIAFGKTLALGGAIDNEGGKIGNLTNVKFINNSAYAEKDGEYKEIGSGTGSKGGAIANFNGTIGDISGEFTGNSAYSATYMADGGAISVNAVEKDAHIGNIKAKFINNFAKVDSTGKDAFAGGGAINIYAENNHKATIQSIADSLFEGNHAISATAPASGGALSLSPESKITDGISNTTFKNNYSLSDTQYTDSGAISNGSELELKEGVSFEGNYTASNESTAQGGAIFNSNTLTIADGVSFSGNYAKSLDCVANGGAILNTKTLNLGANTFEGNYAYADTSGAQAHGGAIYNDSNGNIGTINFTNQASFIGNFVESAHGWQGEGGAIYNKGTINNLNAKFEGNYATSDGVAHGGAIYNEGNLTIAEGTSFINNHVKSAYESKGGAIWTNKDLTLTNQLFTGNYALANMDKAQGGAIYSEANLTFNADNVDILMKGNYVQVGEEIDPEAIYMGTKDKTLTLNATNGGKIQFDDKINGTTDGYNLVLKGGNTENDSIILNNNITNANATLANATLTIGLTDLIKHESDVFKNSSLDVKSGIVTTADSQYSNYNFGKLTSSNDARYVIDMELSKFNQKADTFTVGEGSDGKVHLKRINVIVGDDEHPELVPDDEKEYVVQIIKAKKGEKAPELYYDGAKPLNHAHAHMTNDEILAKGFELYTTDTHFDSILLRGWKDNLAAWAEFEPDPNDPDQTKSFTFTDSSEHTLTRDIEGLKGKDLTLNGAGNNLNLQGHNLFEHIGDGQNVSVSDLNIKNGTPIENEGNLTLDSVGMGEEVEITNDGELNLKGKMDIIPEIHNNKETNIVDGEITLNSKVDGEGDLNIQNSEVGIFGTVQDQHITHSDSNTTLYNVEGFKGNDLVMESGNFNVPQLGMHELHLGEFALNGGNVNIDNVDVDLANKKMGRITADEYTSEDPKGTIYVGDMNLLSDNDALVTPVEFADKAIKDNVKSGVTFAPTPGQRHDVYSPLFRYDVEYSSDGTYGENGYFVFKRHGGSSYESYNPAVLASDVYTQAAGQSAITETYRYVFEHADAFTQLPEATRMAQINADKYALSTDFNDNLGSLCYEHGDDANKAGWVRPYTTFETISLHNGPKVDAITYGTLIGYDTNFRHLKHGWTNVGTGYLGYMGSQLNYSGIDTNMNGGLLGLTETFYKGNFWTAITASVGAGVANTTTSYGHDDTAMIMGGIASKSGYNFEFKEGRYILQPIWQMSYTFVNSFDYTNAAGVRIDSDPSHSIQLNPKLRFIMNTKRGWQPYASVGMVWNLVTHSNSTANGYALPEMNVKPFVEYGLGLQRSWNDKFTAFGQVMLRNGGRTGVALTAGFRWALGRDDDNKNYHQHKHEKVENTINKKQPAVSMQTGGRKIIKQMDYAQKAAFKTKNTSRTTYRATIKSLL